MHTNNTMSIVVTDKSEGIYWEVGLVSQKIRIENFEHIFSLEGFCGGKQRGDKWHWN
jgi:hypothetical protein